MKQRLLNWFLVPAIVAALVGGIGYCMHLLTEHDNRVMARAEADRIQYETDQMAGVLFARYPGGTLDNAVTSRQRMQQLKEIAAMLHSEGVRSLD